MNYFGIILAIIAGILVSRMAVNKKRTVEESQSEGIVADEQEAIPEDALRTLTVSREAQALNSLGSYKVYVNGELVGKLGSGESLSYEITGHAYVQILAGKNGASMSIRAGRNPEINFSTMYGGAIRVNAFDAEIQSIEEGA